MPSPTLGAGDGEDQPTMGRWQRFTGTVSNLMFKPTDGLADGRGDGKRAPLGGDDPTTIPEIEAAIKRANDKERLIGLLAAPFAAGIGLLVTASLIANDPKSLLADGQINRLHVSPSLYTELGLVTIALALVMLVTAWFRKRLILGIACALYGLSIFNLHYWGFGIPFIMIGAWYLVRAYRLQGRLKAAKAAEGIDYTTPLAPPRPSKRYTPPTSPPRRAPKPKPGKELEAG